MKYLDAYEILYPVLTCPAREGRGIAELLCRTLLAVKMAETNPSAGCNYQYTFITRDLEK